MAASGFIKLFSQFRDWEWYQDEAVKSVFIELLLTANYKEIRWQGKIVNRGQLVTSRAKLAANLGKSEQNIRTALAKLESTGEILIQSTNKYTLITICNYDKWQGYEGYDQPTTNQQTNQQLTNEQPTTNQQLTTSKEIYNNNNNNNTTSARTCERDDEKFFAKMRQSFTAWQADACRVLKIDQETLTRYIEEFQIECRAKDSTHVDWKDITTHFFSWGRYHKEGEEKQLKQESYGNNNTNSAGNSRRYWYEPTGQEDYSGDSF